MREACDLVSRTLGEVAKWVAPGITTLKLDTIAREFIQTMAVVPLVSVMAVSPVHSVSRSMR